MTPDNPAPRGRPPAVGPDTSLGLAREVRVSLRPRAVPYTPRARPPIPEPFDGEIVFDLPWPDPELSPNARGHWTVRARAVAMARLTAKVLALEWKVGADRRTALPPPVTADVTFVVADRRRLDADNMLSRLKPVWDGFVDARLLEDDSAAKLRFGPIRFERGEKRTVVVRLRAGP
mgnify:CR=1 FL=1